MTDPGKLLLYRASLPFEWQPGPASAADLRALHADNLEVLHAILVISQPPREPFATENEIQQELYRIESKIHVLATLIGQLLQAHVPPATTVVLGHELVAWQADGPSPGAGEQGVVKVHLSSLYIRPVVLPVTVTGAGEGELAGLTVARMEPLPETVADAWDRLLFTLHRRQIASGRPHP